MKHTTGEWKIIKNHPVIRGISIMNDGNTKPELICELPQIVGDSFTDNREHIEANAKLIAAAPDLLEACEWLYENYGIPYDSESTDEMKAEEEIMLKKAEQAINKAKGE